MNHVGSAFSFGEMLTGENRDPRRGKASAKAIVAAVHAAYEIFDHFHAFLQIKQKPGQIITQRFAQIETWRPQWTNIWQISPACGVVLPGRADLRDETDIITFSNSDASPADTDCGASFSVRRIQFTGHWKGIKEEDGAQEVAIGFPS